MEAHQTWGAEVQSQGYAIAGMNMEEELACLDVRSFDGLRDWGISPWVAHALGVLEEAAHGEAVAFLGEVREPSLEG